MALRPRANGGYGMGLLRSTSFGRKRVSLLNVRTDSQNDDFTATTPSKRKCSDQDSVFSEEKSVLENLPQEILIRIVCGVEHEDLKRLFLVSKAIRETAQNAKQHHFAYSTPRNYIETEAPNAPKQSRVPRHRLSAKQLGNISIALFASGQEKEMGN